jgi:hypothetical protein
MKRKFILFALLALLAGTFYSCKDGLLNDNPILYVVNGTDYSVKVYCDNLLVAKAGAHNNSGKVELSNTSVNLPVYVEVICFDSKGTKVRTIHWDNYYFKWNKSYKMTLTDSSGKLQEL